MKKKFLTAVLIAVFLLSAGMFLRQRAGYRQIAADQTEAQQLAGLEKTPVKATPTLKVPDDPFLPEEVTALMGLDLEALRMINGEVLGWIAIPGTELSYPVVQGADNRYYLNHSWKKESCVGGAVFLESTNSPDIADFHTLIYAHRMRDDSMFGSLKHYSDEDYLQAHPSIYLVTEDAVYQYNLFSTQEAEVTSLVFRLDLEQNHLEEDFLRYCIEGSALDTGIVPEAGDRILTLSTCTERGHAKRWAVHAVLAETYPRC